ncbi:MAG: hypothetical protein ACPGXX_12050, partial [Planctomycetaceae bacterium]
GPGTGTGTITFENEVTLRTDGGVAHNFVDRPDTTTLPGLASPRPAFFDATGADEVIGNTFIFDSTLSSLGDVYNVTFDIAIGAPGEENLRLDIDWRQLADPNPESWYLDFGTYDGVVSRTYSVFDFEAFLDANHGEFLVDFAVSHHQSIQVFSGTIQQGTVSHALDIGNVSGYSVTAGIASSSDQSSTGFEGPDFGGLASSRNVIDPTASNADYFFESAAVRVKIPTQAVAPVPVPEPLREIIPPKTFAEQAPELASVAPEQQELQEAPVEPPVRVSRDIYVLRQYDASGTRDVRGFEEIEAGASLLHPAILRAWIEENNLPGSINYELWLITIKPSEAGEDVRIERPLLRFDVEGQQPSPAAEQPLPDQTPELILEDVPSSELDEQDQGEQPPSSDSDRKDRSKASPDEDLRSQHLPVAPGPQAAAIIGVAAGMTLRQQRKRSRQRESRSLIAAAAVVKARQQHARRFRLTESE